MGATTSSSKFIARTSDWAPYVAGAGIVVPGDDTAAVHFVADALQSTPLPAPWTIATDEEGQRWFTNPRTGECTWRHPLEDVLKSLAELYQRCHSLSADLRDIVLTAMNEKWESEAKGEYAKWASVRTADGDRYYFSMETQEAAWEHPAEVLLPGHYMRIRSIERLRDDRYLAALRCRPLVASVHCSMEREVLDFEPRECRLDVSSPQAKWVTCA
jgi:PAS domain-containing protein